MNKTRILFVNSTLLSINKKGSKESLCFLINSDKTVSIKVDFFTVNRIKEDIYSLIVKFNSFSSVTGLFMTEQSLKEVKEEILDILSRLRKENHSNLFLEWNSQLEVWERIKAIPENLVDFIKLNYPRDKSAKFYKKLTEKLLETGLETCKTVFLKEIQELKEIKDQRVEFLEFVEKEKEKVEALEPLKIDSKRPKIEKGKNTDEAVKVYVTKSKSITKNDKNERVSNDNNSKNEKKSLESLERKKGRLRDPIPLSFYSYLLNVSRKGKESMVFFWQKKVVYLLLYEFGIRANDLRFVTEKNIDQLLSSGKVYLRAEKTRTELPYFLSTNGQEMLSKLCQLKERKIFFDKYDTLGGSFMARLKGKRVITAQDQQYIRQDFVNNLNKDLKKKYEDFLKISKDNKDNKRLKINSHSFRIAFIDSHLSKGIHVAQKLAHHVDVRTTQRYSRYRLTDQQIIELLNHRELK